MQAKQVEVANADQGRLDELATKPGLAALHRDLKVNKLTISSTQPHDTLFYFLIFDTRVKLSVIGVWVQADLIAD